VSRPESPDVEAITDAVDALLDRSIGAEEYVIRAAAEGSEPEPPIDLSQIDFDALAASFAGRKRAETDRLAALLKQRAARLRLDQITYPRVVGQCTWLRGVVPAVSDVVAVHQNYCFKVVFL
jgi:hypothetical protein